MKTIIYKYTLEKSNEAITNEQYRVNGNICAQKTQDEENSEGENSQWRSCGWSCNVEIYIVKWRNILIIVFYSHRVLKLYMRVCHFNPIRKTLAWPHNFTKRWDPDQYKNNIYKTTFWLNYLCLTRKLSIYFCRCFYDLSIGLGTDRTVLTDTHNFHCGIFKLFYYDKNTKFPVREPKWLSCQGYWLLVFQHYHIHNLPVHYRG